MQSALQFIKRVIDRIWDRNRDAIKVVSTSPILSVNNNSITPLAANEIYTGTADDIRGYTGLLLAIETDQNSADGGVSIDYSEDGTHWLNVLFFSHLFNGFAGPGYPLPIAGKFVRISYLNGAVAQKRFTLHLYFLSNMVVERTLAYINSYYETGWFNMLGGYNYSDAKGYLVNVDNLGRFTVNVSGEAEDSAHVSGDAGLPIWSVRNDALNANFLAGTDGDYQALQSTPKGDLRVSNYYPVVVSGTLTRPANVTTYTINDELTDTSGNILTISGCARYNGGAGILDAITVINSVNAATDPTLDIYVFDTTSTPAADNAAFAPTDAVMNTVIIAKSLGTAQNGDTATTGNLIWQLSDLDVPFVCGAASTSLFVRFAVRNGYVPPANSETYTVRLHIRQF